MSDRERSPSVSGSNHSGPGPHDKTPSPVRSRSRSRSVSQHRPHHRVVKSASRSRSPSPRGRKMSYRGSGGRGGEPVAQSGGGPKYRSRSRSPKRYKMARYSRSRSYSPRGGGGGKSGYSDRRREFYRSHSRSPMSSRRRHQGSRVGGHASHQFNRDNPQPSRCLGIFGLSIYTTEQQMHHIMSKYGPVERVQVVIDAKTGRSRGFSFVYFESAEDAKVAKEQCTGMEIDGRRIRVDFSITQRAHTPTPGIYMGKPTYMSEGRGGSSGGGDWGNDRRQKDYYGGGGGYRGGGGGGYRGRSPSPYYRKRGRYERSRSRSYSPRRY